MLVKEKRFPASGSTFIQIQVNGFKRTLDYLKYLEDIASVHDCVLVVSVEWGSLKDTEKAILEKKFDHILPS